MNDKVLSPEDNPTFIETWKMMEQLLQTGQVKTIGVSNFSIKNLERLLPHCSIIPAINQVELHPCHPQNNLKAYCEAKGILLTAYSPFDELKHLHARQKLIHLGRSTVFMENPVIKSLAEKNKASPAQIVLAWAVQRGTVAIPKSENKARMIANITLIKLSTEDMAIIDTLHQAPDMHKSLLVYDNKKDGTVFGWTYEQLGWNIVVGGHVISDV